MMPDTEHDTIAVTLQLPAETYEFLAKEARQAGVGLETYLNSTLSVVLPGGLGAYFTPLSALSFLTFTLLYTPCVAAVAATRREIGSLKWTVAAVMFQTSVAWLASALVFQLGRLAGF